MVVGRKVSNRRRDRLVEELLSGDHWLTDDSVAEEEQRRVSADLVRA